MEVDWPGRPSARRRLADYMVHRITTGHNDTRDFRLERGGVHVRGGRFFKGRKAPFYTPRISVCAMHNAAIKSRIGTTNQPPRQGNANSFCNEEFGSGVRAPHSITVRCYH